MQFRMSALGGVVNAEVARLDPSKGDLVDLVRLLSFRPIIEGLTG